MADTWNMHLNGLVVLIIDYAKCVRLDVGIIATTWRRCFVKMQSKFAPASQWFASTVVIKPFCGVLKGLLRK
jgi:hypothetical protein